MLHYIILFLTLFLTWVCLSGYFTAFFLICGVVSCALCVLIAWRMDRVDGIWQPLAPTLRAPVYFLWIFKEICVSGFSVTRKVWQPEPEIDPVMEWIDTGEHSDVGVVIYANSITLTPGTVAIDLSNRKIFVHALSSSDIKALKEGTMERRVNALTGEES